MSTGQMLPTGQSSAVAQGETGQDKVRLAQAGPLKTAEEWFEPEQNCTGSLADIELPKSSKFYKCPLEICRGVRWGKVS